MNLWNKLSLRNKLIVLFVLMKVLPLITLGWIAWSQSYETAKNLIKETAQLLSTADDKISTIGDTAIADTINALDSHTREEIERLGTDTALAIADFLYRRDADIIYAGSLEPSFDAYRNFIKHKTKRLIYHGPWKLAADGSKWESVDPPYNDDSTAEPGSSDNVTDFHYRQPSHFKTKDKPLYLEITFVGLDGMEQIKVTSSDQMSPTLKNVSNRLNTYAKAETYFKELKKLKPGEVYVSDVIGTYVGSKIIGNYTPKEAQSRNISYQPEKEAYAGKENPVGIRFKGIIRWATPVVRSGKIIGWVTLALDHDHLMQYTDTIVPTKERYRDINDASDGNYAFILDYKGRSIVHPRHHSIVGYDKDTGEPAIPWLEDIIYEDFKKSGLSFSEFIKNVPTFSNQLQSRKPAQELAQSGNVGLDCRWLNFAPQCTGWYNLADPGGSGSFLILWSGLWKLTTTAAIPYYTGQYNPKVTGNKRGFGIVTIGANVNDFHLPATESKERLNVIVRDADRIMAEQGERAKEIVEHDIKKTTIKLTVSTLIMIAIVIFIAIWIASYLSNRIKWLNTGMNRFRLGERDFRFKIKEQSEINQLAISFNDLADALNRNIERLSDEISIRTQKENELREIKENLEVIIAERTQELSNTNELLRDEIEIRRTAEAKAQHLASHDPLTGLANRMLFKENFEKATYQASRSHKSGALLFFDLDKFKYINDTLGHSIGDALLVHVAKILQNRARKTDTVARLGGDEFAVIMTELNEPEDAAIFAQQILDQLEQPVEIAGNKLHIYTSIGITVFTGEKDIDITQALANADIAMCLSKEQGGMHFRFFEESMQHKVLKRKQLENELITALEQHQFVTFFQPIFDTENNKVVSVETLVRWKHPIQGIRTPSTFIDIAINSNLMPRIDAQTIETACHQAKKWLDAGLDFGRISVNVLPTVIAQKGFVDRINNLLERTQLPPERLALEITEQSLIEYDDAINNLFALRDKGVSIYIDDFGVENSSLQRLVQCPINVLKIDRFFINGIHDNKTSTVVNAIIAMAQSLDLSIIAEGIETQEELDYLKSRNCHVIQGYLHSPPLPTEDITEYLKKQQENKE